MPTSQRRSRAYGRTGAPQRKMIWAREVGTTTDDLTRVDLLSDFRAQLGSDVVGTTAIRIRGDIAAHTVAPAGTGTVPSFVVGVRVASEVIVDTADVDPAVDLHEDWMYWRTVLPFQDEADMFFGVTLDVKSMRKIDELGCTLFMYVSKGIDMAAADSIRYGMSTLLKLS